ncbi:MAG: MAPEG family protein [Oleibacter sp.]|nr:MAPEG family protein [Thalassolituus sp.]
MSVYLICISLLGLLVFALGFNVSMARAKSGAVFGGDVDPTSRLYKAQRAHGNTIEYVPMLAILIFALGQVEQSSWVVWTMVAATFCRYLFAAGILLPASMAKPNPMRFVGALGTYVTGFLLVVALIFQAFNR